MSDIIDKVSKAILAAMGEQRGCNLDSCTCWGPEEVLECRMGVNATELAKVAIAAMREPTEAMIESAWADALAEDAKGVWLAMIDEALR